MKRTMRIGALVFAVVAGPFALVGSFDLSTNLMVTAIWMLLLSREP